MFQRNRTTEVKTKKEATITYANGGSKNCLVTCLSSVIKCHGTKNYMNKFGDKFSNKIKKSVIFHA